MAGIEHIKVEPEEAGMRLDRWFKIHYPGLGFGPLQKLLRSGQVRIDGGRAKSDTRVQPGQMIRIPPMDVDPKAVKSGPIAGRDVIRRCFDRAHDFSCRRGRMMVVGTDLTNRIKSVSYCHPVRQ